MTLSGIWSKVRLWANAASSAVYCLLVDPMMAMSDVDENGEGSITGFGQRKGQRRELG